jgi:hypothetical protein
VGVQTWQHCCTRSSRHSRLAALALCLYADMLFMGILEVGK